MDDDKKRSLADDELLQSLKQAQAVLQGVIESPKGVVIFALDHRYRYLAFNQNHFHTMKQIWGVEITLGSCMFDYIQRPDDRQKAKSNFDRALSGESFTLEEEYGDRELSRRYYANNYNPVCDENGSTIGLTVFLTDITERKKIEAERNQLAGDLKDALAEVKVLSGLLPVCSGCKKIRNEAGDWERIEVYIRDHSEADFSHGICPDCAQKMYPEFIKKK